MPDQISADHLAQAEGLYEPQLQSDFVVEIQGLDGSELIQLSVESTALATESSEEVELHYANERRYVAGKAMYETIPLSIKDMVDVGVRNALMAWRRQVYDPATGKRGYAKNYKKRVDLVMYGPDGTAERRQTLIGAWPQQVVGGTLDATASDKVLIELTLRFDKVEEAFQVTA